MSWLYFQDQWALSHKCTFDGVNKLIIVDPNVTALNIRIQVYSDWKEWVQLYDNSKYITAMRTTGGDPIGGGQYTGDVYFLVNGWKLCYDPRNVAVSGVLYSDDYDTAFWDYDSVTPIYPTKVSSIVNTIEVGGGGGGSGLTAAQVWSYPTRLVTNTIPVPPTVTQIRQEMDTNSTRLATIAADTTLIKGYTDTLEASATNILNAVNDLNMTTTAINAQAEGFTLHAGLVTSGSYINTKTLDGTSHVVRDNATAFDCEYLFDIGLNSAPSQVTIIGKITDQHETAVVSAWNYESLSWDVVGTIAGTKTSSNNVFTLFKAHTGFVAGQIGDVRIRFTSQTISDIILTLDQIYVSYVLTQKDDGYSGHAVSATSSTVVLGPEASNTDDYYVPSILVVNHGTGAQQFAKVIEYSGASRTLILEKPMAVTLDATSHITLKPWATADMPTTQYNNLVSQIAGLTPQQETMILEMYRLMGLDPSKPLVVTKTARTAGAGISQTISGDANTTVVTRV